MTSCPDLTPLGAAILNLLDERPMHPYDMIQLLASRGEDRWVKVRPSSLYHQVERLVGLGFAEVVGTEQQGRRPPRTTYRITDRGGAVLTEWVSAHVRDVEDTYPSFSLALGQLGTLPPERALTDLHSRSADLATRIQELDAQLARVRDKGVPRIWLLAHEHAHDTLTCERRFVDGIIHDIEKDSLTWPNP